MIAALMKKLATYKANKTIKFTAAEAANDEFMVKALLSQLVALKRNKTAIKFADLEVRWLCGRGGIDGGLTGRQLPTARLPSPGAPPSSSSPPLLPCGSTRWRAHLGVCGRLPPPRRPLPACASLFSSYLSTNLPHSHSFPFLFPPPFPQAMDETAADEVLLSKLFASLSAWKAAKANATSWKKFSTADVATAADDEVLLTKMWAMLAAKKNKTRFAADASFDGVSTEADPEFMLSAIWAKLAAWKNKTRFSAPEAADDETLLALLYAKLAAKKNGTAWKKFSAEDESAVDDLETNEYFLHRLNKTALASTIATKFNATVAAKAALFNKVCERKGRVEVKSCRTHDGCARRERVGKGLWEETKKSSSSPTHPSFSFFLTQTPPPPHTDRRLDRQEQDHVGLNPLSPALCGSRESDPSFLFF